MLGAHVEALDVNIATCALSLDHQPTPGIGLLAAYPKDHCHFERNAVMEAFLDGRPDRAWLSSIVGPTGSLVDLYRHALCPLYPYHSRRIMVMCGILDGRADCASLLSNEGLIGLLGTYRPACINLHSRTLELPCLRSKRLICKTMWSICW